MKPVLGNVVALTDEARSLLGRRNWCRTNPWTIQRKQLCDGIHLLSVQSGMGLENAFSAAKWLVWQKVSALTVTGVSGGLNPDLDAGDIIIADGISEVKDTTIRDDWKTDKICADLAYEALLDSGFSVHRGMIISASRPLLTQQQKAAAFQKSNALVIDMESAAIAHVANDANIPLFVMRAVCDSAETTVPQELFDLIDRNGAFRWSKLFRMLLYRPFLMNDLVHMGRAFHAALRALNRGWQLQVENNLPGRLASR